MDCSHDGFRDISSTYDVGGKLLVFVWTCERCGKHMGEAGREKYQPRYQPGGNDGPVTSGASND